MKIYKVHILKKNTLGVCCAIALIGSVIAWFTYPALSNMKSEYSTTFAITDLGEFIDAHQRWPSSEQVLYPGGSTNKGVFIDYNMTLEQLRARPELLKESVRPVSGKFYTYPHYEQKLEDLAEKISKLAR